jgi:hypothetical protein
VERSVADRLDGWIGDPQVRTHHRREAGVAPAALWESAETLRLRETRTLGRLVGWRIPGTPMELTFRELLRRYPFTVLEEGEHYSISGMCGRIWTLGRDYPQLRDPGEFSEWDQPGTVRVAFASWTEPADGGATLFNEARVEPVDRRAALRLRALWVAIGRFEPLIGKEAIGRAVRRAEESAER